MKWKKFANWLGVLRAAAAQTGEPTAAQEEAFQKSPARSFAVHLVCAVDSSGMDVEELRELTKGKAR